MLYYATNNINNRLNSPQPIQNNFRLCFYVYVFYQKIAFKAISKRADEGIWTPDLLFTKQLLYR